MSEDELIHDLDRHETDIALYDPAFEVTWLPGGEVHEGSPARGFQAVNIVGFELNLIERAVAALAKGKR